MFSPEYSGDSVFASSHAVAYALLKHFGLPLDAYSLNINFESGRFARVTVGFCPADDAFSQISQTFQHYELRLCTDVAASREAESAA